MLDAGIERQLHGMSTKEGYMPSTHKLSSSAQPSSAEPAAGDVPHGVLNLQQPSHTRGSQLSLNIGPSTSLQSLQLSDSSHSAGVGLCALPHSSQGVTVTGAIPPAEAKLATSQHNTLKGLEMAHVPIAVVSKDHVDNGHDGLLAQLADTLQRNQEAHDKQLAVAAKQALCRPVSARTQIRLKLQVRFYLLCRTFVLWLKSAILF